MAKKFANLPPGIRYSIIGAGACLALSGIWMIGSAQEKPVLPDDAIIKQEELVDAGPLAISEARTPEDLAVLNRELSEGVELYGYVDSWPENGEEVYAIGFDTKRYPYTDMRNIRRLAAYAEHLMLDNGNGTLKLLVYTKGRKYGDGADLLITATVGKATRVLSSGSFPWLETAASHPVKPDDVAKAFSDKSGRLLKKLVGKNLLITMPVTEFYQAANDEWIVISADAPVGYMPFPLPLRLQPNDPLLKEVKAGKQCTFAVVLAFDEQTGRSLAYGKPAVLNGKPIPDGIPISELK